MINYDRIELWYKITHYVHTRTNVASFKDYLQDNKFTAARLLTKAILHEVDLDFTNLDVTILNPDKQYELRIQVYI